MNATLLAAASAIWQNPAASGYLQWELFGRYSTVPDSLGS